MCRSFVSTFAIFEMSSFIVWRLTLYSVIWWSELNSIFLNRFNHQINSLSTCSMINNSISMIDVDIVVCFFVAQSIRSSNSLNVYSSTDLRSFSFANAASAVASKTCFLFSSISSSFFETSNLIVKCLCHKDIWSDDSLRSDESIQNWLSALSALRRLWQYLIDWLLLSSILISSFCDTRAYD